MTIRPKSSDIDLLVRLIDMRDSAHLAGHTEDPFNLLEFNNGTVLFSPGRAENANVSTFAMRRLQDLGLLRVTDVRATGFTFDLMDDVRDQLEEMRVALGQPSRMGELLAAAERAEAARERAEGAQRDQMAEVREAATRRAESRAAFAIRVGRLVRRATAIALGTVYVGVVVVTGYFVSSNLPLALVVGIVGVGVGLAVLDWVLHIDGFGLAAGVESWTVRRITCWLESFDTEP